MNKREFVPDWIGAATYSSRLVQRKGFVARRICRLYISVHRHTQIIKMKIALTVVVVVLCMTMSSAAPGVVYMSMQLPPSQHQTQHLTQQVQAIPAAEDQGSCEKSNNTKRLLTFNVALGASNSQTQERRGLLPVAMAEEDSDVICLQGLWLQEDAQNSMSLMKETHPYSFSTFHGKNRNLPPCVELTMIKLSICILWNKCISPSTAEERLMCTLSTCLTHVNDLSQECRTCLVTNTVSTCLTTPGMNIPGLLLLSKTPMTNTSATPFIAHVPLLMPRYYLSADIQDAGHVVCTHLTANASGPYFEVNLADRFASYKEQHAAEVQTLITSLASRSDDIIMGDLNASPSIPTAGIAGDFEDSYNALTNASYTSFYVSNVTLCTYCHGDPIADGEADFILDHVLTKSNNQICAQRAYDKKIDGTNLSSHYGVKVDIEI